jgi:basic amino acid/polyamine antiporter, APA family
MVEKRVEASSDKAELKKSLGFGSIIALTITSMVGSGMFLGTAIGAKYSGNGVLIAWGILILLSTYIAMCFGELIALFPKAGGVYEFSKQAYGNFFSFLVGWLTWVMSTLGTTILIIASLDYLLPADFSFSLRIIIAISLIVLFNFIAYLGVEISGAVLIIFAVETVLLFASIIFPGFTLINISNYTPIISGSFLMVFASLFFMFESLMGWESASFLAEETRDAAKVIPKALVITTLIAGFMGLLLAVVTLGIIPAASLTPTSTFDIAAAVLGPQGAKLISFGIVLALLGSVVGSIISTPRLLLAMARDKLFISQLSKVHPVRKTPYNAIVFQCVASILILLATLGNYGLILSIFTPISLLVYSAIILTIPVLRYKLKDVKRDFKVPFGIIGPIIISLIYLGVIASWLYASPSSWQIINVSFSLVLFGLPIYILMIFFYNPDAVAKFSDTVGRVNLWFESLLLPRKIRREMLSVSSNIYEKRILEYGAGVGTFTLDLVHETGPKGLIYATELSGGNAKLIRKRLDKRGIKNVVVIHDEHHSSRIHPDVKMVDAAYSVGVLSYIQDPKKFLKELSRRLPENGSICLVEYVNYFHFIPDKEWLSNHAELKKMFRDAGFSVKIHTRKGVVWNYLFIYGIKTQYDVPVI